MTIVRSLVLVLGALMIAMGLLWLCQGTGLVHWPRESFMLGERKWAVNGLLLAAVGMIVIWLGRSIGRSR